MEREKSEREGSEKETENRKDGERRSPLLQSYSLRSGVIYSLRSREMKEGLPLLHSTRYARERIRKKVPLSSNPLATARDQLKKIFLSFNLLATLGSNLLATLGRREKEGPPTP